MRCMYFMQADETGGVCCPKSSYRIIILPTSHLQNDPVLLAPLCVAYATLCVCLSVFVSLFVCIDAFDAFAAIWTNDDDNDDDHRMTLTHESDQEIKPDESLCVYICCTLSKHYYHCYNAAGTPNTNKQLN